MAIPSKFSGREIGYVTFDDESGPVTVFNVTGTVQVNIVCVCTTPLASAGAANISLGIGVGADIGALIPVTVASLIIAGEIWHDATPDKEIELSSVINESVISDSNDIVLTLSAQIETGALEFYCFWTALSPDGLVRW